MNGPIINPWLFYLASRLNAILAASALLLVAGIIMIIFHYVSVYVDDERHPRMLKNGIRIVIVGSVLLCIIPGEQTLYKMLLAHYATPDNINDVINMIIDGARRIAEATNG